MHPKILQFIENISQDEILVNKLIVSLFIEANKINLKNNLLIKSYLVKSEDKDYASYIELKDIYDKYYNANFSFDNLIELFEFVISPSDKKINGSVYTPQNIREFIVKKTFVKLKKDKRFIIGDISCGCGGFLYNVSIELRNILKCSYSSIFDKYIWGLDIKKYSIERCKIILTLLALKNGEDKKAFSFNLFIGNALNYNWNNHHNIRRNKGFDAIIGNPPYVCSRNIDDESKLLLNKWTVNSSGHPDLYITFFEIGMQNLRNKGILSLITVNSFFRSLNGRSLRKYFYDNTFDLEIIDFGSEQVFKTRYTYTCICFIQNKRGSIKYIKEYSNNLLLNKIIYDSVLNYEELGYRSWILSSPREIRIIKKIEATGNPLSKMYKIRTGIATLKNDVYKFKPITEDDNYYYFIKNNKHYQVEKNICKKILNTNKITPNNNIDTLKEKIIFPYIHNNNILELLPVNILKNEFPFAYKYLSDFKNILSMRDKGINHYPNWYAYGRNQSLNQYPIKLLFPHICSTPSFFLDEDPDLLFYNGMAITHDNKEELLLLKKILESKIFLYYIKQTSKPYSSNYFSLSKNYIGSFGFCLLNNDDKLFLLKNNNEDTINSFLFEKYQIRNDEIKLIR